MTMTGAEDYLKEIIRLQLKKPRSWNWELTTSKSSPHISLPTIQLYDTKGQLLVETNDNGTTNRQNWHSSQYREKSKDRESGRSSKNPVYLQRCRSDNLEKRMAQYRASIGSSVQPTFEIEAKETRKQPKAVARCRSNTIAVPLTEQSKNLLTESIRPARSRSKDNRIDNLRTKYDLETHEKSSAGPSDSHKSNKGKLGKFGQFLEGMKDDKRETKDTGEIYRLQKSRSDVLDMKVKPKPVHTLSEKHPIRPYHKRSDSDSLIEKTRQKYNIQESLKRAQNDGYKNLIYSNENIMRNYRAKSMENREITLAKREKSLDKKEQSENMSNSKKKWMHGCLATAETVICNNNPTNFKINNVAKPKRYRLRQSRAGILVISDESFSSSHRRRCHGEFGDCRNDSNDIIMDEDKMNFLDDVPIFKEKPISFRCAAERSRCEKDQVDVRRTLHDVSSNNNSRSSRHFRQSSDPAGVKTAKFPSNRYRRPQHTNNVSNNVEQTDSTRQALFVKSSPKKENCLFQSKSDVFPFQKLFNDNSTKNYDIYDNALTLKLDDNCNYLVQEPLTTTGSDSDKNVCDTVSISNDFGKNRRTKVRGRYSDDVYPRTMRKEIIEGTEIRPILSDFEVEQLTAEQYLSPWTPEVTKLPGISDYAVGKNKKFLSVQEAVNAAILENVNSTNRKFIFVDEGVYEETVFIPSGSAPITIYGHENSRIVLNQSANMSVTDWINQVNPNGSRYQKGDPAYSIYESCAIHKDTIGTRCTSVMWIKSNETGLVNITIENSGMDGQAVALRSDAMEIQLENVRLLGHQDTLYVGSGNIFINNSYLEGDTDYVFGLGTAVLNNCTLKSLSNRKSSSVIFAPETDFASKYGFLVTNSIITSDDGLKNTTKVRLGRPWDSSVYIPDQSPNGQILIKNTRIDGIINVTGPWGQGIGSAREFRADISEYRDINDNRFNRFWEFQNYGDGA